MLTFKNLSLGIKFVDGWEAFIIIINHILSDKLYEKNSLMRAMDILIIYFPYARAYIDSFCYYFATKNVPLYEEKEFQ